MEPHNTMGLKVLTLQLSLPVHRSVFKSEPGLQAGLISWVIAVLLEL